MIVTDTVKSYINTIHFAFSILFFLYVFQGLRKRVNNGCCV